MACITTGIPYQTNDVITYMPLSKIKLTDKSELSFLGSHHNLAEWSIQ